jgi:superfamily II RNA helicase
MSESEIGKSVFLVPLRALADEKARSFAFNYREYGLKVHLSMSEIDFKEEEIEKCNILISTYERFKTILGRMPHLISSIKNVVIDEFHLIGDESRGQVLETILTAIKDNVRLILLSATIANPEDIANWLNGTLVQSKKRFIPLEFEIIPTLQPEKELKKIIKNNVAEKAQILIFSGTRIKAEENALEYSDFIYDCCKKTADFNPEQIKSFLQQYSIPQNTIGNKLLYKLINSGTAFHHAGLSSITKKLIEEMFRKKWIKVLFCTETLGAGINLPAREVVILDTKRWNDEWLSRNVFHQIAGRAGRPDYDLYGKCTILAVDFQEKRAILNRYWANGESQYKNLFKELEPKYDTITSKIFSREEFERMALTLIYGLNPTKEELIELLVNTYYNYNYLYKTLKTSSDRDISKPFFDLILDYNQENFEKTVKLLDMLFETSNLETGDLFEDDEKQIIEISNGHTSSFVTINKGIFSCSCNNKTIFCKHRLFVLKQLPEKQSTILLASISPILPDLIKNEYIYEKTSGRLHTTTKGTIWAEMGIVRRKFEYLREWLIYDLFTKGIDLVSVLQECLRISKIFDSSFYLDYNEFRKPLYEFLILKKAFIDIISKYQLYEGDLFRIIVTLKSTLTGLIPLSEFLGLTKTKELLETLDMLITDRVYKIN